MSKPAQPRPPLPSLVSLLLLVGGECQSLDECSDDAQNDCNANAHCIQLDGGFDCLCKPGFGGNGRTCSDETSAPTRGSSSVIQMLNVSTKLAPTVVSASRVTKETERHVSIWTNVRSVLIRVIQTHIASILMDPSRAQVVLPMYLSKRLGSDLVHANRFTTTVSDLTCSFPRYHQYRRFVASRSHVWRISRSAFQQSYKDRCTSGLVLM